MITPLSANLETIALIGLLIGGFVVAFKLLEMIFETVMVSVLSAGFYAAMAITLNYNLTVNNLLLFAFLGSSLYMAFSMATSAYTVISKLVSIPINIGKSVYGAVSRLQTPEHKKKHSKLKKKVENYGKRIEEMSEQLEQKYSNHQTPDYRDRTQENNENEESQDDGKEVKEVVLNKVKENKKPDTSNEDNDESSKDDDVEEFRI
jgi:hypothetical protein